MYDLTQEIEDLLPYLRRYARAMTGSRQQGDKLAASALQSLLHRPSAFDDSKSTKVVLFQALQDLREDESQTANGGLSDAEARANQHLARLEPGSRDALLLKAFEQFSDEEIAQILRIDPSDVPRLIDVARTDIANATKGRVLVIEDEASIAVDIESIVSSMGHNVIGSAPTENAALELAQAQAPDLILSDVQLANGGSGIAAVSELLSTYPKVPVIFITGFPEMLLTGEGPEPAFLIAKPYSNEQVRSAVSQAMFFADRPN